jgi:hypothetical protein
MTAQIGFVKDDGGRAAAGFQGRTGDCVVRAIGIATGRPYRDVYDELHARVKAWLVEPARGKRQRRTRERYRGRGGSPRNGVPIEVVRRYLAELGWNWTPTMKIGTGCTVHLAASELPAGRLIVQVSRHVVAVIDGVIHDTHDCGRDGARCVYGYWRNGAV